MTVQFLIKSFARKQGNLNTQISGIACLSDGKQVMYDHRPDGLRICCQAGGEYSSRLASSPASTLR